MTKGGEPAIVDKTRNGSRITFLKSDEDGNQHKHLLKRALTTIQGLSHYQ